MDHYIIGKLLEEEKVDIFDVQKAVEENYPDFEDEEFDIMNAKGRPRPLDKCRAPR